MKLILVILLISVTFTAATGQRKIEDKEPKCTLGMDHAPELRGFRLAATQQSLLARFPGVSIEKPDKFGLARLRLTLIDSVGLIKGPVTRDKGVMADITAKLKSGAITTGVTA